MYTSVFVRIVDTAGGDTTPADSRRTAPSAHTRSILTTWCMVITGARTDSWKIRVGRFPRRPCRAPICNTVPEYPADCIRRWSDGYATARARRSHPPTRNSPRCAEYPPACINRQSVKRGAELKRAKTAKWALANRLGTCNKDVVNFFTSLHVTLVARCRKLNF